MEPIQKFIGLIADKILNPIIVLGFIVATIYFFYGIVKFIYKADSDKDLEDGKRSIMYGLFGMFIMFSVYGIIRLILGSFNISEPDIFRGM